MARLRTLLADGWVIGIASAIAVGYAVVAFVRSAAQLVVDAIEGTDVTGPLSAHGVSYRGVLASGATLVAVVGLAAVVLRFTERPEE